MTITGLRRATRNYLTALTISAGIVTGTSAGWRVDRGDEVVRVHRRALVDDRWDPGEIVPGANPAVVVIEQPVSSARADVIGSN